MGRSEGGQQGSGFSLTPKPPRALRQLRAPVCAHQVRMPLDAHQRQLDPSAAPAPGAGRSAGPRHLHMGTVRQGPADLLQGGEEGRGAALHAMAADQLPPRVDHPLLEQLPPAKKSTSDMSVTLTTPCTQHG